MFIYDYICGEIIIFFQRIICTLNNVTITTTLTNQILGQIQRILCNVGSCRIAFIVMLHMMPGTGSPSNKANSCSTSQNTVNTDVIKDGTDIAEQLDMNMAACDVAEQNLDSREHISEKDIANFPRRPKIPRKPTWLKTFSPDQRKEVKFDAVDSISGVVPVSDK